MTLTTGLELTELERSVIDMQLVGTHEALAALRRQAASVRLRRRELSGVGFYCHLDVDEGTAAVQADFEISDVHGSLGGLKVGFVLFVRCGRLALLEGFTFGERWPDKIEDFNLAYDKEPRILSLDW